MESTPTRTIIATDTAKLIRIHLKAYGTTFKVRTDRSTGSISVTWTDGPTVKQVETVTDGFAGGRFQSSTDCNYSATSWYCPEHGARSAQTYGSDYEPDNNVQRSRCCSQAEHVHFGTRFVQATRRLSREFLEELAVQIRRDCGMDPNAPMDMQVPEGSRWHYGIYSTVNESARLFSRDVPQLPF